MVANGKLLLFSDMFALAGLALSLFLSVPWPADLGAEELDFETSGGSKSSSSEFSMFVPFDSRVLFSKVPVGIKDLSVKPTADSDLDVVTLSNSDQSLGGSIWIKGIPNIKGGTLQSGHPG
ncbi:MAG: hypothetical protein FI712_10985 [SAR202 cluster bacterium]|nr:hypothetical protein [SAR202 cluster bacterium]